MKRIFLIIALLSTFIFAEAQRRYPVYILYSLGVKMGPDFNMYDFNDATVSNNDQLIEKFNYTAGGIFCYSAGYFIDLRTGLEYTNKNFAVEYDWSYIPDTDPDKPNFPERVDWNVGYLGIPALVNFNFAQFGRFRLYLSGGVKAEVIFNQKETVTKVNGVKAESGSVRFINTNFNRLTLNAQGSLGIKYKFHENFSFELEPWYRYYLTQMHDDFFTGNMAFGATLNFYYDWW